MPSELETLASKISSLDLRAPGSQIQLETSSDEVSRVVEEINALCKQADASLEEAKKFSADVAHQLRTPLAVLTARITSDKGVLDRDDVQRDVTWMTRLVNQLLANARIMQAPPDNAQRMDLSALALDVVMSLAPLAIHRGKNIELTDGETPIWVDGHTDLAFEAVSNLVENAIAHSPIGETVTIVAKPPNQLEVVDQGSGIPPQEATKIFDRFGQGQVPTKGGAGLGLAIVSAVMDKHGGSVEYVDRLGVGAVFRLTFRTGTE